MAKPYSHLRAQMSLDAQRQAEETARAMLDALLPGGWSLWAYPVTHDSPYHYRAVEVWRAEWDSPRVVNPWSLPLQMNVVDLYWRPLREDTPHA